MSNCLFRMEDKLFFRETSFFDLINRYFYINMIDSSKHLLYEVRDEERIHFLYNNPENLIPGLGSASADLNNLQGLGDSDMLSAIRYMDNEKRFNRMVYFPEIYAPLVKVWRYTPVI